MGFLLLLLLLCFLLLHKINKQGYGLARKGHGNRAFVVTWHFHRVGVFEIDITKCATKLLSREAEQALLRPGPLSVHSPA